ncbi:MFS transporter [Pseudotabrizicola sp. L79]|uniref:MFS transporter n=1 Tax=Pseudotabrizicola sp. L79 TaxID=3118402 RepID=UPI002F9396F8
MRSVLTVIAVWCAGLGAAAQFGKVSILFEAFSRQYSDHSLVAVGLVVSIVGIVGLIFGTTAGLVVARIGPRRAMVAALGAGAAMSAVQALGLGYPLMIASRIVEGFSHLTIVVVGPTVMAAMATDRTRGLVMTLWSSFFGMAYTLLALFAPWQVEGLFLGHAVWLLICGMALAVLLPADPPSPGRPKGGGLWAQHLAIYRSPQMAAPAMGFFCYTFLYVALLTLVPPQVPGALRGFVAGAMPFVSIAVSLTLGVWLLSRLSPVRLVQMGYWAAIPAFGVLALGWGHGPTMAVAALWLSAALGLVQGASFAAIPVLNPTAEGRARAAGAVAQLGNLGTTTGTPVIAAILATGGAKGLALVAIAACLLGIGLHALQARRRQIFST